MYMFSELLYNWQFVVINYFPVISWNNTVPTNSMHKESINFINKKINKSNVLNIGPRAFGTIHRLVVLRSFEKGLVEG